MTEELQLQSRFSEQEVTVGRAIRNEIGHLQKKS